GVFAVRLDSRYSNGMWEVGHQTPVLAPTVAETADCSLYPGRTFWAWLKEFQNDRYFSGDEKVWHLWSGVPMEYLPPD
ncbi:hypothetical protein VU00_13051, partial [Candidatus Electrothrix marina]